MSTFPPIPPPPGFDKLSKEEQIRYIQQLWDLITTSPDEVPVPQWHLDIVRDRIASCDLEEVSPWGEVKQRLLSKYRDC